MNGIKSLRGFARASMFACVFTVAVPFGLVAVSGCSDAPPEGATAKQDTGAQKDIDTMKNFMKGQSGTPKK